MGDAQHIEILRMGVNTWNQWRRENNRIEPNLTRANFSGQNLAGVDLRGAGLFKTDFSNCDLQGAILRQSRMVETDFRGANLTGAHIYGSSVWNVKVDNAIQTDLVITRPNEALIAVDDIQVAQFIYLIINNSNIRNVIDTLTSKSVLILGNFSPDRKGVLKAIKEELRKIGYLPILFDFDGPTSRTTTETVKTLALLSRYVIADITEPKSIPFELHAIVPEIRIPVLALMQEGHETFSMFHDLRIYQWVARDIVEYRDEYHVRQLLPKIDHIVNSIRSKMLNW